MVDARQSGLNQAMNNVMAVFLNGIAQLEYDRDRLLPDHQAAYLDKMDAKMDAGILVGNETVTEPDQNQRTQFAAANLAHALQAQDEAVAAAMCSYLAIRLPDLKQVKIEYEDGEISIEFIFDEPYRKQVAVDFSGLH
jgi:hypothetical protein